MSHMPKNIIASPFPSSPLTITSIFNYQFQSLMWNKFHFKLIEAFQKEESELAIHILEAYKV